MPRAEVGSTKYLNNKLKSKGLQRLRWYCQVCERQMRDDNGFKCHTQSESHVRQMLLVGEDPRKHISDYSNQFQRDFLQLLRTSHGEKKIHMNHFYQEYISNKEHIHMNSTRWPSLTEFAKFLGREGLCRVEDNEKGLHISWIDNSPEALRRQDAIRKKERQDKGDEQREQRLIREQIERADLDAEGRAQDNETDESRVLKREEGEKIKLDFGGKRKEVKDPPSPSPHRDEDVAGNSMGETEVGISVSPPAEISTAPTEKLSLKVGTSNKPKNVFAGASKKNALSQMRPKPKEMPKKPMSEAERIMREELDRKRVREASGFAGLNTKRQRVS
ncbi:hypothetical protein MMC07_005534 [Pseudocyphellaria aurata]|nr:hypothetical protein [Pseudocyphellaria aurata]